MTGCRRVQFLETLAPVLSVAAIEFGSRRNGSGLLRLLTLYKLGEVIDATADRPPVALVSPVVATLMEALELYAANTYRTKEEAYRIIGAQTCKAPGTIKNWIAGVPKNMPTLQ